MGVKLDADLIYGFSASVLSARYDNPLPTPSFHKELWEMCSGKHKRVAIAAPRGCAKTTAVTHAYTLASVLFRIKTNVLIISDTESQAKAFLGDIKMELLENDILRSDFGIAEFIKDNETEVIVQFTDGKMFRILARGAEQKLRGLKWRGKRPDLILLDDAENEELVANPDRRAKFHEWFLGAVIPAGSDSCQIRVVGTVLHLDSLLEKLLNSPSWYSRRYEAHNDDFSVLLWPEKLSEKKLRELRKMYIDDGKPDVYEREYRNRPLSAAHAYFQPSDFRPILDHNEPLNYYITADLAVSTATKADYSAFVVAGINSSNVLKIVQVVKDRMDSNEIINTLFGLVAHYKPDIVGIEGGPIGRTLTPLINSEMMRKNRIFMLETLTPIGDKRTRAQAIRARMRHGAVQFDTKADWFGDLQAEMLVFDKGAHDDQVDAMAWLGIILDKMMDAPTRQELEQEAYNEFVAENEQYEENLGLVFDCGY